MSVHLVYSSSIMTGNWLWNKVESLRSSRWRIWITRWSDSVCNPVNSNFVKFLLNNYYKIKFKTILMNVIVESLKSLKNFIDQSVHLLIKPHHASILWFEVDPPYMKLSLLRKSRLHLCMKIVGKQQCFHFLFLYPLVLCELYHLTGEHSPPSTLP